MEAIVAVFSDWGIGSEGTQQLVLKADRAHFRELTAGAAVIVGRRTLGDFPGGRPLKGRSTIVVTLVIGGASVYRQFLPFIDLIHVTKIDLAPASDSFFENLDTSTDFRIREEAEWQEENGIRYQFLTYERVK